MLFPSADGAKVHPQIGPGLALSIVPEQSAKQSARIDACVQVGVGVGVGVGLLPEFPKEKEESPGPPN
jgi:hypothetical protein